MSKQKNQYWVCLASSMTINRINYIAFGRCKEIYYEKESIKVSFLSYYFITILKFIDNDWNNYSLTLNEMENRIFLRKLYLLFGYRLFIIEFPLWAPLIFTSLSFFLSHISMITGKLILRIVVAHQTAKGIIFWLFVHPFWFIFTAISPTEFL